MIDAPSPQTHPPESDRRDDASRERLLARVRLAFHEMPCLRLTVPQVRRLFMLRDDVCVRVLATLVREGMLWLGSDGRYGMRQSQV